MNSLKKFLELCKPLIPILQALKECGGISYIVGGTVRDLVLDYEIKDIDIEVHKLSLEQLQKQLEIFGTVKLVGKQFGVLRLLKRDVDWSLPRRDSAGRKPTVIIDSEMTIEQACRRRDLTMNAMAINLNVLLENFDALYEKVVKKNQQLNVNEHLEFIDPYGGLKDLEQKVLKAVDKKLFLEDPLRFFRVMQFIGRFQMLPDDELNELCRSMDLHDPTTKVPLARERIYEEIKKLFLKSARPSLGLHWLKEINRLQEIFPEVYALIGVQQRPDYHPEGDVFEHTMQAIDAAAQLDLYQDTETMSYDQEKFLIVLATLCHDLGKATTTDENLHCFEHAEEGVEIARTLVKRITNDAFLLKAMSRLVKYHRHPFSFIRDKAKSKAYKRLALKLAPEVSMRQLALLALSDARGRNSKSSEPLKDGIEEFEHFLKRAEKLEVLEKPEPPVLLGRHIKDVVSPGPEMGEMLKESYKIQLEEGIQDVDELKKRICELFNK